MVIKSYWSLLTFLWLTMILWNQPRMVWSFSLGKILIQEQKTSPFKTANIKIVGVTQTEENISSQTSLLENLQRYADRIRKRQAVDLQPSEFQDILDQIPRDYHLSSSAKQDLYTLFEFAKLKSIEAFESAKIENLKEWQELQDYLFEIRFSIALEDEWSTNQNLEDIDTLWQVLRDLPDDNVEENTSIYEILLGQDEDDSWFESLTISITSRVLSNQEKFEDMVRREVGHAVLHNQKTKVVGDTDLVNDWLKAEFGWQIFSTTDKEIDAWVNLMGGWKKPKNSGMNEIEEWEKLRRSEISEIREYLRAVLGDGNKWGPSSASLPTLHPGNGEKFAPKLAVEKSTRDWYKHFEKWQRVDNKAFALNYKDQKFMAVNKTTLDLIAQMPSNEAAMSPSKFFGELYALYYDLDDPKRSVISSEIAAWFEDNIGTSIMN